MQTFIIKLIYLVQFIGVSEQDENSVVKFKICKTSYSSIFVDFLHSLLLGSAGLYLHTTTLDILCVVASLPLNSSLQA